MSWSGGREGPEDRVDVQVRLAETWGRAGARCMETVAGPMRHLADRRGPQLGPVPNVFAKYVAAQEIQNPDHD